MSSTYRRRPGARCPSPHPGNAGFGGLFGSVLNLKFRDSLTAMIRFWGTILVIY